MKAPPWLERIREQRSRPVQVSIVLLTAWVPLGLYWNGHEFIAAIALLLGTALFFYFNPTQLGWRTKPGPVKKRRWYSR